MGIKLQLLLATAVLLVALVCAWFCLPPLPPKICGSPCGPPLTTERIKLRDGRFLAYHESGVAKGDAKYKIVYAHGYTGSRLETVGAPKEALEEMGVYVVSYDRPGYGESDPDPKRSVKRAAMDVEDLADALQLGPKFYLIAYSLGGHVAWGCLKYIPHRLEGAALMAPVVNWRWNGIPKKLRKKVCAGRSKGELMMTRIAYHAPWLINWWLTQPWFPSSPFFKGRLPLINNRDIMINQHLTKTGLIFEMMGRATQQGAHESLHRDILVMFGKWEFDPLTDLPIIQQQQQQQQQPRVHLWQGNEDGLVPVEFNRYIAGERLPAAWIQYHELNTTGHFLSGVPHLPQTIINTMILSSSELVINSLIN